LATRILEWVGVTTTAGTELWPLDAWAELRTTVIDDPVRSGPAHVRADVERVLTAMRIRPRWFEQYVEVPLGRKEAPVPPTGVDHGASEWPAFEIVPAAERADALLVELAGLALDSIEERLTAGEDPEVVVPEVVEEIFLGFLGANGEADPGTWSADRIPVLVAAVLAILRGTAGPQ